MEFLKMFSSVNDLTWYGFLIRTLAVGLLLGIFGKLVPLRAAGGLSALDFTFFWMMGGLIASPLFDAKISFRDTLIAAVTILLTHKIIATFAFKYRWVDIFVKGKSVPIIDNGLINEKTMRSNLVNNEILFSELRKNDIFHVSKTQLAYYENNGHLSVLTYPENHTITKKDLKLPEQETVAPQLLISDGKVDIASLVRTNLNSSQLLKEIHKQGFSSYKDIFIGYWEDAKNLFIQRKQKNK